MIAFAEATLDEYFTQVLYPIAARKSISFSSNELDSALMFAIDAVIVSKVAFFMQSGSSVRNHGKRKTVIHRNRAKERASRNGDPVSATHIKKFSCLEDEAVKMTVSFPVCGTSVFAVYCRKQFSYNQPLYQIYL